MHNFIKEVWIIKDSDSKNAHELSAYLSKVHYYSMSVESVFDSLKTGSVGLTSDEASRRLQENGKNILGDFKGPSVLHLLLRQFNNFAVAIMIVAAILSYGLGELLEAFVIQLIVVFVILISFFEEYKASRDLEALKNLTPKRTTVIRDQKSEVILSADLVAGDVVHLRRGDMVPADLRIIESNDLYVDESTLTGESQSVIKESEILMGEISLSEQTNMLFSGTTITDGDGVGVVVRTGKETEMGKISGMMADIDDDLTPLQKRLNKLSEQLTFIIIIVATIILIVGLMRGETIITMIHLAIAVCISGIPEALPTVVAVALAVGVKRMAQKNAIIKKVPAVETLGATTVICTDKTGTLTQNKMVIEEIFTLDAEVKVTGKGFDPRGLFLIEDAEISPKDHHSLSKLIEIGLFCNNSDLRHEEDDWKIEGESTEGALIVMAEKAGYKKEEYHLKSPRVKLHPFDARRKCMSAVHVHENVPIVYAKGAPEILLDKCESYLFKGEIKRLDSVIKGRIMAKNEAFARNGLRVLGLAYKEHKAGKYEIDDVESALIFVGLVSIRDPPEPSARLSVQLCKAAGINVVMITGDNQITAEAIAKELGILGKQGTVVTGQELDAMSNYDLLNRIENIQVYARVTPEHKYRIVKYLHVKGHVVAMTGDGVNDAPALKKADIGVAMGRCGTEVAKEAADMVILDDNFTTIVSAIKEGRTIFENIRKFIYYLLVGNISEVSLILLAVLFDFPLPLTALMILYINLVTSEFPALGLCVESADRDIMQRKPRDIKEGVLSDILIGNILQIVPIVVGGTLLVFVWELLVAGGSIAKAQTLAFLSIIMFEMFHIFVVKSWKSTAFSKDIFNNKIMWGGVIFTLLLTVWVVNSPITNEIFGTVPISLWEWISITLISSSILWYKELEKYTMRAEMSERARMQINYYPTRR